MTDVAALTAHARSVSATDRAELSLAIRALGPLPAVRLETCHRVELHGPIEVIEGVAARLGRSEFELQRGEAAVAHLIRVAVGRDSAVVGEDQVLHQLRLAVRAARRETELDPALGRLLDLALGAGRRARSWIPAGRPSLASVAVGLLDASPGDDRPVLVVGAGGVGQDVVSLLVAQGRPVLIASRTAARARALARSRGAGHAPFEPGPDAVRSAGGIIVALSGPWELAGPTEAAIEAVAPVVVDLSAPPALAPRLAATLGGRYVGIDDLARGTDFAVADPALVERLDALIASTVGEFMDWARQEPQRSAMTALVRRAHADEAEELADLWRRIPDLDEAQRAAIAGMARRLQARLLRQPLGRLHDDVDGRHARAARELFGL